MIGIVLGAGHGRRVGGPKALVAYGGSSLAARHATRMFAAGCREVLVVLREAVAAFIHLPERARRVVSGADDQAGSLAVGLRAIVVPGDEAVCIAPVDVIPARIATFHALDRALREGAVAATPRYRGAGGHPVMVRAGALAAYRDRVVAPKPLSDVFAALGTARVRVDVDDPAVVREIDSLDDAARILGRPLVFVPR